MHTTSCSPLSASLSSVNVEAMALAEVSEAKTVLARIDERKASKMAAAAQAADEGAMFPDPMPQHRPHHGPNHHHHRQHHHTRKRRSSGGRSLPPAEASPLKQAQLLRQREKSTAAAAAQEKASNGVRNDAGGLAVSELEGIGRHGGRPEDDREGGGGIGGSALRGDARSMALEATSEGLGGYSRSSCSSEGARCVGCHAMR